MVKQDLTEGSVFSNLLSFSLPFLLAYFLQTLYGTVDLFLVGRLCDVASTTAVSVGSQIMHMLTVMIVGLSMGTTVCVAQAVGARDSKQAARSVGNSAGLFLSVSLVLTMVLMLSVRAVVGWMSTPAEAVEGTVAYLKVCFFGIPLIAAYNTVCAAFRGLGDSKSPMIFVAISCAVNIGLDILLIGPMNLGPIGAALGTVLAQAVSVVCAWGAFLRQKAVRLQKSDWRPQKREIRQLLSVGLPVAMQDGLVQVGFILITVIANRRGLTDAAAVGIVEKMIGFLFLVPSSMLSGVSAIAAQNLGAGQEKRARQTLFYAMALSAGFGLAATLAVLPTAPLLVHLFTREDAVALAGGAYLRGYIPDCLLAGIHFCFSGYFCACNRSGISFLHNIIAVALVRVPGAYFASRWFPDTLFPMGLSTVAGSLLSVIICCVAFGTIEKGRRRKEG